MFKSYRTAEYEFLIVKLNYFINVMYLLRYIIIEFVYLGEDGIVLSLRK